MINHDPFDSINARERSALFLKRLRDIRMRYDETTTKIPIIESFYQSGIFIYEMKEINYAYCDPMKVRELQDNLAILNELKSFPVRFPPKQPNEKKPLKSKQLKQITEKKQSKREMKRNERKKQCH